MLSHPLPLIVLFGAFDRHNLGDLLLPHVLARLLAPGEVVLAGLAARDLTAYGGLRVRALAELMELAEARPVRLVHVGGELLGCDTWEAAVMLLTPREARSLIAAHPDVAEALAWAQGWLRVPRRAAYVAPRSALPQVERLAFVAVGGVGLAARDAAFRDEVCAALRGADFLTVRDAVTQAALRAAGIEADLLPDPAVMVPALLGAEVAVRAQAGEVGTAVSRFPQGYVAAQLATEFGDDATLDQFAAQLDRAAGDRGLGTVLFRAGAAPWHDDTATLQRLAARLTTPAVVFDSLHVLDLCALLARARAYCGSSLHGRIVAEAYAVPGVTVMAPSAAAQERPTKHAAYLGTWLAPADVRVVPVAGVAAALEGALAADRDRLAAASAALAARFRRGLRALV